MICAISWAEGVRRRAIVGAIRPAASRSLAAMVCASHVWRGSCMGLFSGTGVVAQVLRSPMVWVRLIGAGGAGGVL